MMWPFKKRQAQPPYDSIVAGIYGMKAIIAACEAKDRALYDSLKHLPSNLFWPAWKDKYPEDFPQGGQTIASADAIRQRAA